MALADALYGSASFVNEIQKEYPNVQIITLIRSNQLIKNHRGLHQSVGDYFSRTKKKNINIKIRGNKSKIIMISASKLYIKAHGQKRLVIAVKYSGEKDFRYIIATEMTWRAIDIIQAYSLRWLIEVFFQDWKSYEGWSQMAKQQGIEGSCRGVILSLLLDHSLFLHHDQKPCIENKLPLCTIGSLIQKCRLEIYLNFFRSIMESKNPKNELKKFIKLWKKFQ